MKALQIFLLDNHKYWILKFWLEKTFIPGF